MSSILKGKHIIAEVNGERCTIVETGVNKARMQFLKDLLEFNHYKVYTESKTDDKGESFTVAVTDLLFNPVIAIYESKLRTKEGKVVTPAYWKQETTLIDSRYWVVRRRLKE